MYCINKNSIYGLLKKAKDIKLARLGLSFVFVLSLTVFVLGICPASEAFQGAVSATINAEYTVPDYDDTDYDGIPNAYDLDPDDPQDAHKDSDNDIINSDGITVGDGLSNLDEYRLGTDPLSSNSGINVRIEATPASGIQPLDVTFTAHVTADGGYNIVKYEWDFDGNGTYDYSSCSPSVQYKYTTPGAIDDAGNRVYYAKLRVINNRGRAGVTTATINIERDETLFPPTASAVVGVPAVVSTPSIWEFAGSGSADVAKYQWDLSGNGEYDFTSTKSGGVTHTYKDTNPQSFSVYFKVTDTDGYSEIDSFPVSLDVARWHNAPDKNFRPVIEFGNHGAGNRYIVYAMAGQQVTLKGSAIPLGYRNTGQDLFGWVKKLEWDFESDGVYDWVLEQQASAWQQTIAQGEKTNAKHTYGSPGIYRATLRATTDINLTATDHVLVIVEDISNCPTAVATVNYNSVVGASEITGSSGEAAALPVETTFVSSASYMHPGHIKEYKWDFDGDKRFDYSSGNPDDVVYTYTSPGYYLACLEVAAATGATDTVYIPVFVAMPDTYASVIMMPKENQTIAGNAVTLICRVLPDDGGVNTVMFQYSADSGTTWADIGLGEPVASYSVTWDTTGLSDGDYLIRALVNASADATPFLSLSVTIGNSAPAGDIDIYENANGEIHTKKTKVNPNDATNIVLPDGMRIEIPMGALQSNGTDDVYIEVENDSASSGGTVDINFKDKSGNILTDVTLTADITISLPYPDEDQNGIVDGTGINENDLVVRWYNQATGEWGAIYESVVYPVENIVCAKINHLSLFSWAAGSIISAVLGGGSSSSTDGDVSYCFIATAAYGSADAQDVITLRRFRDKFLLTNNLGKQFVQCYYKYSPPIAKYIKSKPLLKKIIRLALKPLVKFAEWRLKETRSLSIK